MKKYLLAIIAGVFIGVILISVSIMMASPTCFSSLQNQFTGFVTADLQRDTSPSTCETSFNSCTADCNNWLTTCNQKCDSGSIIEECYSYCSRQDTSCTPKCTTTYDTCFKTERQKRTPLAEITKICTEQKNTCEKECNPKITECRDTCKEKSDPATCKNKCTEKKQNTCDVNCTTKLNQCKSAQPASQTTESKETSLATTQTRTSATTQQTISQRERVSKVENGSEIVQEIPPSSPEPQQQPEQAQQRQERSTSQPPTTQQAASQQPTQLAQSQTQINIDDYKKRIDALIEATKNGKITDELFKKNMERLQKTFPQLNVEQVVSNLAEVKSGIKTYDDLKQLLYQIVQSQETSLPLKPLQHVVDNLKDSLSTQQQIADTSRDTQPQIDEEKDQSLESTDGAPEDISNQELGLEEPVINSDEDLSTGDDLEQWLADTSADDTSARALSAQEDQFSDEEWDISSFEEDYNADDYGFEDFETSDSGDESTSGGFGSEVTDEFTDLGDNTGVTDENAVLEGGEDALPSDEELGLEEDLSLEEALGEEPPGEEVSSSEKADAEQPSEEKKQKVMVEEADDKIVIKRIDGADVKIVDGTIREAKAGATLREKTKIVTGEESKTNLNYKTNVQARIDARTELFVKKLEKKNFVETIRLKQETGTSTYKIVKNPEIKPDIETPNAIVRIDGVVEVKYDKDSRTTTVRVFEGKAYVTSLVEKRATPQPLTDKQETTIRGKSNLFMRIANALR